MSAVKPSTTLRVWDLATRLFHWVLVLCIAALFVSGKVGGDWMNWHLRLGHVVLALLLFRIIWGFIGGHWSRFFTFIPGPGRLLRYLKGQGAAADTVGHNPLGAFSVLAMLAIIGLQVGSGLMTDDEIFYSGSLVNLVSGEMVESATTVHKTWGQWLLLGIIGLHIAALVFYSLIRRQRLVPAMVLGDKHDCPSNLPASRDGAIQRILGLVVFALCAGAAWWVWNLA